MIKRSINIEREISKEISPAILVQLASKFESRIYIEQNNKNINAKSIMGMMTLVLNNGDKLLLSCDGNDENKAMEAMLSYLK